MASSSLVRRTSWRPTIGEVSFVFSTETATPSPWVLALLWLRTTWVDFLTRSPSMRSASMTASTTDRLCLPSTDERAAGYCGGFGQLGRAIRAASPHLGGAWPQPHRQLVFSRLASTIHICILELEYYIPTSGQAAVGGRDGPPIHRQRGAQGLRRTVQRRLAPHRAFTSMHAPPQFASLARLRVCRGHRHIGARCRIGVAPGAMGACWSHLALLRSVNSGLVYM